MIIKKITRLSLSIMMFATLLVAGLGLAAPQPAFAGTSKDAACEALELTGGNCGGNQAEKKVSSLVSTIVNVLSWIVGIAAVIMIIVSGFKYVTSSGDSNSVSGAKSTLIYAVVGLIIVALAQFIVRFVLQQV